MVDSPVVVESAPISSDSPVAAFLPADSTVDLRAQPRAISLPEAPSVADPNATPYGGSIEGIVPGPSASW